MGTGEQEIDLMGTVGVEGEQSILGLCQKELS